MFVRASIFLLYSSNVLSGGSLQIFCDVQALEAVRIADNVVKKEEEEEDEDETSQVETAIIEKNKPQDDFHYSLSILMMTSLATHLRGVLASHPSCFLSVFLLL